MIGTYLILITITLALMSIYIISVLKNRLYDNEKVTLFAKANIIADTISPHFQSGDINLVEKDIGQIIAGTSIRAIAADKAFHVCFDSNRELNGKIFLRDIVNISSKGEQAFSISSSPQDIKMLSVAVPIKDKNKTVGVIYLIESIDFLANTVFFIKFNLLLISVLICFLVGILSFGMSYIVTSPIDEFISVAKEISRGNFEKKVSVKGHNEYSQMAETLNYMTGELQNLEERRRKFISDVSHELKTPLATIKLICDSIVDTPNPDIEMVQDFLNDLSNEVDRLTRIVERLLALTRLDADKTVTKPVPVDLPSMLHAIVRNLTPKSTEKGIVLHSKYADDISHEVMLDYDRIWEAVYNIIDNAIKYSPEGGFINVSLTKDGKNAIIKIEDNGPGIPDSEKERVFERFYRLDDSRARDTGGTGLGLAIAMEAVQLHGGSIEITNNTGSGSIFTVYLPVLNDNPENKS